MNQEVRKMRATLELMLRKGWNGDFNTIVAAAQEINKKYPGSITFLQVKEEKEPEQTSFDLDVEEKEVPKEILETEYEAFTPARWDEARAEYKDKLIAFTDGSTIEFSFSGCGMVIGNYKTDNPHMYDADDIIQKGYSYSFNATNNRAEITAAIQALEKMKEIGAKEAVIVSDSKYVVDAIEKGWVDKWRAKGWKLSSNKPALNVDLWIKLTSLIKDFDDVKFIWVRGHQDNILNEVADDLAVKGSNEARIESMKRS